MARILAQFKSEEGSLVGVPLDLPSDVNVESLGDLCNALLENVSEVLSQSLIDLLINYYQEEPTPFEFYVHEKEVVGTLLDTLEKIESHDSEKLLEITYLPQAKFRVQAITRCSSSIPGT